MKSVSDESSNISIMLPIYVTFELLMVKGKQIDLGQRQMDLYLGYEEACYNVFCFM